MSRNHRNNPAAPVDYSEAERARTVSQAVTSGQPRDCACVCLFIKVSASTPPSEREGADGGETATPPPEDHPLSHANAALHTWTHLSHPDVSGDASPGNIKDLCKCEELHL